MRRLISWNSLGVASIVLIGLALRLPPLWAHRFHQDEALYASWALLISTRRDLMLHTVPVDKPPLFFYILARFFTWFGSSEVVARLPGLIAGVLSIWLVYLLAQRLYDKRTAWLATALFTASPMAILFSPTAFTDPLMLFFGLAGCLAGAYGAWGLAGLGVGLAAVTKQQGILFLPLALGLGWISRRGNESAGRRGSEMAGKHGLIAHPGLWPLALPGYHWVIPLSLFVLGTAYPIWKAIQWDGWRHLPPDRPGFLVQSVISYGGLALVPVAKWPARVMEWLPWLGYLTGSPLLNALLAVGLPWLGWRAWRWRGESAARVDGVLLSYGLAYMALHVVLSFQVWDRYLLPLAPIVALLGARVLWALTAKVKTAKLTRGEGDRKRARLVTAILVALLAVLLAVPAVKAARSGFPVGSDHGAYDGIDQVAAFLKAELPTGAVLYHRWLGWHWRYYLFDVLFNFRYYDSTEALVADADGPPEIIRYIVFPGWHLAERDEVQAALAERGIALIHRFETRRADGSVSFIVYRIERIRPHAP
ncbi:MAG: glycosyltransferase family 39 protein [Anaerolineae bacterium]|nr:glycosyltransferase family 39 protein [Anaerolineae bacterium]MDW8099825.1 glycosyltransferase family 39 protein [Anaerolineae bacterium]